MKKKLNWIMIILIIITFSGIYADYIIQAQINKNQDDISVLKYELQGYAPTCTRASRNNITVLNSTRCGINYNKYIKPNENAICFSRENCAKEFNSSFDCNYQEKCFVMCYAKYGQPINITIKIHPQCTEETLKRQLNG